MQKKLIAAAVAALASTAVMADATVYGRLDIGYGSKSTETTGNAKTSVTDTGAQSKLTTSRLGWNVKEDLGGGLSAFGNLELGINTLSKTSLAGDDSDNGGAAINPFNTRTAYLGLKSESAGSLTLGRQWVLVDQVMGVGSVGGLNNTVGNIYNNFTAANGSGKQNNTRSSSLITYSSPNFGGVSFAASYGAGSDETAPGNEHDELGLMVKYSGGPLTVALGYNTEETSPAVGGGAATQDATQLALAGTYDLGVAKIYALYMDGDDTAAGVGLNGRDGIEVGASFPLGATKLFVSYFTGETDDVVGANDRDHSGFQLGALYSLSKRTTAYAMYGTAEAERNDGTIGSREETEMVVGVRHDF